MERRTFFLTGAGMLAAQTPPGSQLSMGLIGSGGRGRYIMSLMKKDPAVQIGAVCDVYEPNLEEGLVGSGRSEGLSQLPEAARRQNYQTL